MARELTGSGQARRAGVWDEVRPEALVPRERDPVTGSLTGRADADGGAKDRRTESGRHEASHPAASGPRASAVPRRWLAVAGGGLAVLVIGVGGAVALVNRDADDPGPATPTPTGTAGPSASSAPPSQPGTVVGGSLDERLYSGTLTSLSEGEVLSSGQGSVRVRCLEECRLFFIGSSSREVTWPLAETDVSLTLPQEGDISAWCADGDFTPAESWRITVSEEALSFTRTSPASEAECPDGITTSLPDRAVEFSGTRTG